MHLSLLLTQVEMGLWELVSVKCDTEMPRRCIGLVQAYRISMPVSPEGTFVWEPRLPF